LLADAQDGERWYAIVGPVFEANALLGFVVIWGEKDLADDDLRE
jgi:hypothetical protein